MRFQQEACVEKQYKNKQKTLSLIAEFAWICFSFKGAAHPTMTNLSVFTLMSFQSRMLLFFPVEHKGREFEEYSTMTIHSNQGLSRSQDEGK